RPPACGGKSGEIRGGSRPSPLLPERAICPIATDSLAGAPRPLQGQLIMKRPLLTLSAAAFLSLSFTFALGCCSKLTCGLHAGRGSAFMLHFLFGLFTAVGTLLVHCLIFTYFLGTGRWVKEVTLAYDLPDEPWHKRTRELKRQTFPPALAAMLVT